MNWIKKWLPTRNHLIRHKSLKPFQHFLHSSDLWKFNHNTIAKGCAIGVFINFIPIPLQTLWAAFFSYLWRANLPIAVLITWINNPFTFVAINYLIYKTGSFILKQENSPVSAAAFPWKTENMREFWDAFYLWFQQFGKAYLVGLPILSLGGALISYCLVIVAWKLWVFIKKK